MATGGLYVSVTVRPWAVRLLFPFWYLQALLEFEPYVPRWCVKVGGKR